MSSESVPFEQVVDFAIGGGWGSEAEGEVPVVVIRGTDFARVAAGDLSSCPRRFETAKRVSKRALEAGDIILEISGGSRASGQTTGRSLLITQELLDAAESTLIPASFCRRIKLKPTVDPRYAYFHLQDMHLSGRAARYEIQSTGISNFQFKHFLSSEQIRLPSQAEQRRIAWVLGSLDDKIELNRRIAKTLEQIVAAIFKARFVDFVGVEEFEESELGLIPKGWEVASLGDHVEVIKGRSYKSEELAPSETALVTLKSIQRGGGYSPRGAKPYTGDFRADQEVQPGDVVVAHTDLTQARDVIARPAIVRPTPPYSRLVASLDLAVVRPRTGRLSRSYLFGLFQTDRFIEHAFGYANGSTVLHLNKAAIPEFRFPLPSCKLVNEFSALADRVHAWIAHLEQEEATIASIRDTLLPKLVSGSVRVPEGFGPDDAPEVAKELVGSESEESGTQAPVSSGLGR